MIGKVKVNDIDDVKRALINKRTRQEFPDQPLVECPRCGLLIPDFDGFGVLSHVHQPDDRWPPPCGYCSHPAIDGDTCAICGEKQHTKKFRSSKIP